VIGQGSYLRRLSGLYLFLFYFLLLSVLFLLSFFLLGVKVR
jgi:hypothetical protein